ncbi:Prolyl endopeptidase precursor [compost metagenome]
MSERLPMRKDEVAWVSPNKFLYQELMRPVPMVKSWDSQTQKVEIETNVTSIIGGKEDRSFIHNGREFILISPQGEQFVVPFKYGLGAYMGKLGDNFVFKTDRRDGFGLVEFFNPNKTEQRPPIDLNGRVVAGAGIKGDFIAVDHSYGTDRRYSVFDKENKLVGELVLPAGITAGSLTWIEPGKVANISFTSPIRSGVTLKWDLSTQVDMAAISQKLHNDGTTQFESHFETVKSADGVEVPMRITAKAGLEKNGQNPVMITVYGGFSKPGSMHGASPETMKKIFLDKGGILVAPAIRGGNEFGEVWHAQATGAQNKTKTLEDLISVADYLTAQKYTDSSKIITMGTSNGGFVVAAAALKSPNSFGLAIPVAGVHDMLGKERLAIASDWAFEYGDPANPDMYKMIKEFSPIEFKLNEKPKAEFLLITGRDDTRVNTVHTYKLMKSLKDQNITVNMLDMKNAGHWAESPAYQNVIGWRVQSVVWNRIFEFLGIKL